MVMIGTKSADSTFYEIYKAYHIPEYKPELKPVSCIGWKILQSTNPALRFV